MTFDKKELEKSQIEFTITVSPSDYAPFLQKSATKIANKMNIKIAIINCNLHLKSTRFLCIYKPFNKLIFNLAFPLNL